MSMICWLHSEGKPNSLGGSHREDMLGRGNDHVGIPTSQGGKYPGSKYVPGCCLHTIKSWINGVKPNNLQELQSIDLETNSLWSPIASPPRGHCTVT